MPKRLMLDKAARNTNNGINFNPGVTGLGNSSTIKISGEIKSCHHIQRKTKKPDSRKFISYKAYATNVHKIQVATKQ